MCVFTRICEHIDLTEKKRSFCGGSHVARDFSSCGSGHEIGANKLELWQHGFVSMCGKYHIVASNIVLNLFLLLSYIVMFCISCKKILPFWHAKKISFSTRKNLVLFVRIADTFSNNYEYI